MSGTFRVTLLGTGGPAPHAERFGPATLIEAGRYRLLFDAGRGATIRLHQLGIALGSIDAVFLTHFHSDHVVGLPDLWLTGWLPPPFGRRRSALRVIGPTGTLALTRGRELAYAADIEARCAAEHLDSAGAAVETEEFAADGVVWAAGAIRVKAFAVDHGAGVGPAYGYRIEHGDRAVVLAGDTRFSEAVIGHAAGAELLVHGTALAAPRLTTAGHVRRILRMHTSPAEVATVFRRAQPGMAVLTHVVLLGALDLAAPGMEDVVGAIRKGYDGPLTVGEDLMSFDLAEHSMRIIRPPLDNR